jgi:hypothetical protein
MPPTAALCSTPLDPVAVRRPANFLGEIMATSYRHVLRGKHGRIRGNFNLPGIIKSRQAVVNVTAGEITSAPSSEVMSPDGKLVSQDFAYKLGDADVWVSNVSPHFNDHFEGEQGGVEYILHVNWDSPLDVAVTITVEDSTPIGID